MLSTFILAGLATLVSADGVTVTGDGFVKYDITGHPSLGWADPQIKTKST